MKRIRLKSANKFLIALAVAILAWGESVANTDTGAADTDVRVARPAPRFSLKDANGRTVSLGDFAGKALIVCFIATWDKPSQKQIATLIELQSQYADNDLVVLAISLNQTGVKTVKDFAMANDVNYPILMVDYDVLQGFGGLEAIPTTFAIDKNHNIIHKYVGIVEKSILETDLKPILK